MPPAGLHGRSVTLVVVSRSGRVLGALAPFDVETPWWQEVEPIRRAVPGVAVLRMLDAEPAPGHVMGGRVTYLVEALDGASTALGQPGVLRDWGGRLTDDPLRMPWAHPGGPEADLEWAAAQVPINGPAVQRRTWNLSSIWSLPTEDGLIWLKCVPPFFGHEAAVLSLLGTERVPRLLAADSHRMLLADLPGHDGYFAPFEAHRDLIDVLVDLQLSTIDRIGELRAAGVPDGRWHGLLEAADAVVRRWAPEDEALRQLIDTADRRIDAIAECGLPDVLVHGDAHSGNARVGEGAGTGIWFDWGDCRIGHPITDVAVLARPGTEQAEALRTHWLDRWARSLPGTDPHRAWQLVRPLAALGEAVTYQGFLDGIEASERPYHVNDVLPCLAKAAALARA
ncbi:MAG: aminoglycoside phosphotransferase family protein [Acidimicrobiales bacterium]|jgi:hypothetical protein